MIHRISTNRAAQHHILFFNNIYQIINRGSLELINVNVNNAIINYLSNYRILIMKIETNR